MGWRAILNFNGWQPTTAPWNELKQILTARKDGQPTINDMNSEFLTILAIVLMAPFTVLVVALNMKRSNQRYLSKLKQQADKKAKNNIK